MIALQDGQDAYPTRVKISPGRRGAQKPGFGENTSLHYGYTIVVMNSRQQQVTSIYSVTQRRRCYAMQEKYGWRLLRIKPTKDSILKYSCIRELNRSYPNYLHSFQI
ncbi:MAG TPA: hypothetical protein VLA84_12025 [Microcoleus sp.]|nr:hypothetical protein [Microcoleus sp.]